MGEAARHQLQRCAASDPPRSALDAGAGLGADHQHRLRRREGRIFTRVGLLGAKGGIIAFSKTIACEAARAGVTANCVCPGPTDTPALRALAGAGGDAEAAIQAMTKTIPMRRAAQPADIAAAVAFFASDEAGYITGQTLSVSGGLTMA